MQLWSSLTLNPCVSGPRNTRERVKMGVLASDSFKMLQKQTKSGQPTGGVLQGFVRKNPVGAAERTYLFKNGAKAFNQLLERLLNDLLSK